MIPCITGRISTVHGIITAIREEIEVGGRVVEVYASVCGNKSTDRGIVIPTSQIIKPRLAVVVVPAVTYRINYAYVV